MKKTTYIIIGMLFASLLFLVGIICFIATLGGDREDNFYKMKDEMTTVQLPVAPYIHFSQPAPIYKDTVQNSIHMRYIEYSVSHDRTPLTVTPTTEAPSLTLSADMERFLHAEVRGDTLFLSLDIPREALPQHIDDLSQIKIVAPEMTLAAPAGMTQVDVHLKGMKTTFRGWEQPDFAFFTEDGAWVEQCHFRNLYPASRLGTVHLISGTVDNLYIDCDETKAWEVNPSAFHIDTEYLTGSRSSVNNIREGECREVVWTPKNRGAKLEVTLHEAARITFPK